MALIHVLQIVRRNGNPGTFLEGDISGFSVMALREQQRAAVVDVNVGKTFSRRGFMTFLIKVMVEGCQKTKLTTVNFN